MCEKGGCGGLREAGLHPDHREDLREVFERWVWGGEAVIQIIGKTSGWREGVGKTSGRSVGVGEAFIPAIEKRFREVCEGGGIRICHFPGWGNIEGPA